MYACLDLYCPLLAWDVCYARTEMVFDTLLSVRGLYAMNCENVVGQTGQ